MKWHRMVRFMPVVVTVIVSGLAGCAGGAFVQGGVGDRTPPHIERVKVEPNTLIAMGRQVRVEATVTDEGSGVERVDAAVTFPDGRKETVSLQAQAGEVFAGAFVAEWNMAGMPIEAARWVVEVAVRAIDRAGNEVRSEPITVQVAIPPPQLPPDF